MNQPNLLRYEGTLGATAKSFLSLYMYCITPWHHNTNVSTPAMKVHYTPSDEYLDSILPCCMQWLHISHLYVT